MLCLVLMNKPKTSTSSTNAVASTSTSKTSVTLNPKYFLTDFRIIQGYDLNPERGYGMQWYNSNNPEGFIVDGITSPQESRFDPDRDQWRCIVGPNGWMVHRSMWDAQYRTQADISVHYRDDNLHRDPPDVFPGDLGYYFVESAVRSLEPRKYSFQLEWYWPDDLFSPEGLRMDLIDQIINIRDHPLRIFAGDREAVNSGGTGSLVEP